MAQSAFAAGGGNAKMAQLKKLQANRNMSPAQLRKLVEQIGRRNLNQSKPKPTSGQPSSNIKAPRQAYTDGQIVVKEGNKFRYNAKTRQFTLVQQPAAAKPKPKPQPPAAKPKPKPKPARSSTYSQADMMKDMRATDRAAARSKELEKLKKLREEAKQKSLKIGRQNRSRRNTTGRGPRG